MDQTLYGDTYEIKSVIGKGGMSTVYLAEHKRLHTLFAVKEVRKAQGTKFDFLAESNLLKHLQHPMLPRIVDIFEDRENVYIVEDYVEGVTLEEVLRRQKKVEEDQVLRWFKELCGVLDYLHRQHPPIIYRDMKPANVMVQPDGTLKLIDFGIAREYKQGSNADTSYVGTRGYAAPEQFGLAQTDARTDIYSLGVTMYHLLTGRGPYEPPYQCVPVRKLDPTLSRKTERIVEKCVQPDPDKRYQSVRELLADLESAGGTGGRGARGAVFSARRKQAVGLGVMFLLSVVLMIAGRAQMGPADSAGDGYQNVSDPYGEEQGDGQGTPQGGAPDTQGTPSQPESGTQPENSTQPETGTQPENSTQPENGTPGGEPGPVEEITASGTCGNNLTWRLNSEGVLTVSGAGEMDDFDYGEQPWSRIKSKIAALVLEEGVTSIGMNAFDSCGMTSVSLPSSLRTIGENCMRFSSGLTSVTIPEGVTTIGDGAFDTSKLEELSISSTVTSIGERAFYHSTHLREVTIPGAVTEMGEDVFWRCEGLTTVTVGDGVKEIADGMFRDCKALASVSLPDSLERIGEYAFRECDALTSVRLPDTVTEIGFGAYDMCHNLTSVTIPAGVTSIGPYAFGYDSNLTDIYYGGSEADWANIEIGSNNDGLDGAVIHFNSAG